LLPIIAILLISPVLIKWNNYKENIISDFKILTGHDLVMEGNVTGSFLPFFKITLANVKINGNINNISSILNSDLLEIYFNPLYLIKSQFKITSLRAVNGDMVIADLDDKKNNISNILQDISSSSKIELENFTLNYLKKDNIVIDKFKLRNLLLSSKDDVINLTFNSNPFDSKELILVKLSVDKNNNIIGDIKSNIVNSAFNGMANQIDGNYQFNGKINGNIINLNKLLISFFNNSIITDISSTESGNFMSDIVISSNRANFNNIIFESDSFKTKGNFEANFADKSIINLDLDIDKLNLDSLYKKQNDIMHKFSRFNSSQKQEIGKLMYYIKAPKSNINIAISENIDLLAMLEIRNIIHNGKTINKAQISVALEKKIMDLYYANIELDDSTNLFISGILSSNEFRPIFDGILEVNNKDLNSLSSWLGYDLSAASSFLQNNLSLKSSVRLTPQEISLGNIGGVIKEYPIEGNIKIKFDQDLPQITLALNVDKADLDNLNITKIAQAQSFIDNIQTRSDLLDRISWLRFLDAEFHLSFNFNELTAYENKIQDFGGSLSLLPGSIRFEDITINNEKNSLITDLAVNIKTLNPQLNININGDNLHLDDVDNYLWSGENIKLPNFDWFDGDISINLANLSIGNLGMKDFNADLKMGDQILYINKMSSKIFDGNVDVKGSLVVGQPTIGLSFSFVNIMAEKLLALFPNMDNIAGYLSLSGSIQSEGKNKISLLKNTQASVAVAIRKLNIKNFDLLSIIKTYNDNSRLDDNGMNNKLSPYLSSGATLFDSADGNLTMSAGIIEVPKLTLHNQRAAGVFSGSMDFGSGACVALSEISFFPNQHSKEVILRISLDGNISNPNKKIVQNKDVIKTRNNAMNH
jgi:hypothetical protein